MPDIDLTKLDPATRAQHLGNPQGEIGVAGQTDSSPLAKFGNFPPHSFCGLVSLEGSFLQTTLG